MSRKAKEIALAAGLGLFAAVFTLLIAAWVSGGGDDVDGEFELVEPGIFTEPTGDANPEFTGLVPPVALTDVDGDEVYLDSYAGKPMVVNVWFSNCVPCATELVDFATVHAEVGDEVQFVGIDPFDTADTMVRFASERGVEYDLLRDVDFEFVNEVGIVAYPVTMFVDGDGRILRQTGVIDADGLRSAIEELF